MPDDIPADPAEPPVVPTPPVSVPSLGFSITSNITDRSQIVIQSFVPLDASDEEINGVLDKVMRSVDRQRAKYQLKDFKLKLEMEQATLEDQVSRLADLKNAYQSEWTASNRRGDFKLTTQQNAAISNAQKTIEGMKFNVDRYKKGLEELEATAK